MNKEQRFSGRDVEAPSFEARRVDKVGEKASSEGERQDDERQSAKEVSVLRKKIEGLEPEVAGASDLVKIDQFQERYLPEYLNSPRPSITSRFFSWAVRMKEKLSGREVVGRENIPEQGPYLVVSNHFGGETGPLLSLFNKDNLHIAAGEETNFKRSGFRSWLLKRLGMLPIKESAAKLDAGQRQELLQRVPGAVRQAAYSEIFRNSENGVVNNLPFMRAAIAAMSRGDAVAVFPEGVFTYDEQKALKQAYGGFDFLAKKYKELTGKDLPILPVGISGKKIVIQPLTSYEKNQTEMENTDWIMAQLAKGLPEDERGYYHDLAEKI